MGLPNIGNYRGIVKMRQTLVGFISIQEETKNPDLSVGVHRFFDWLTLSASYWKSPEYAHADWMNFPSVSIAAKTKLEALFAEVAVNVTEFDTGAQV